MMYFAYGSNMDPSQITKRIGHNINSQGIARLDKYKFGYYGHSITWSLSGTADIIPTNNPKDYVLGILYDLSDNDFKKLDKFEGISRGRYRRISINLIWTNRPLRASTYILKRDGSWKYSEERNAPSLEYVKCCEEAAQLVNLPESYIKKIILSY